MTVAKAAAPTGGNLPADQIIVWLSQNAMGGPVPALTPAQAEALRQQVDAIAADLHATSVLPLTGGGRPERAAGTRWARRPARLGQLGKPAPR